MIGPARIAALGVLQSVGDARADLPSALAHARTNLKDERDRALLVELATGTLRWLGAIDHLIVHAARRPLGKLDPEVRDVLRLGIYQLLHLDRVPASAVVDDAVEMTRRAGKSSAAGFVNAILRQVSRSRTALPLPVRPAMDPAGRPADREAALDYLSTTLSHPRWLVARWLDAHGFDATERWAQFNNEPAPLTLRTNTLRTTRAFLEHELRRHGVQCRHTRIAPDGLVVTDGNPLQTPLAESGLFLLQDEASQAVACLALASRGERVLDTCASPGGKSLAMAAAVGADGLVIAGDIRGRRLDLLRGTLTRGGADRAHVVQIDLNRALPFDQVFDCVFVDAPCSGLGTIRRDPEIRWRRTADDLERLAAAQFRMVDYATRAVRPGGRLVYATCSSEPEENELVLAAFLNATREFAPLARHEIRDRLPGGTKDLINDAGHLRSWPWQHGLEAFFGAVCVRVGGPP
jgi:16S rRNA (cytosine967-C5)-methyltransferase